MNINYQKNIASSQATLPVVGVIVTLMWYLLPDTWHHTTFDGNDYLLWQYIPSALTGGIWSVTASILLSSTSVYLMAELNNSNMLLRVSSRMLSSMLAMMTGILLSLHELHPGHLLMLFSMLSLFPILSSYQQPSPLLTFNAFLFLSLSSLAFPKILWSATLYWTLFCMLRAMTARCAVASLLALLLPYWLIGGAVIYTGETQDFLAHLHSIIDFRWHDYSNIPAYTTVPFIFFTILFFIGSADFFANRYQDKTRTRISLTAAIAHGAFYIIAMALQPQYITVLLPLLLISASIMFGHYFTLTHTKLSHILMCVILTAAIAVIVLQYDIAIAENIDNASSTIKKWIHSISFL